MRRALAVLALLAACRSKEPPPAAVTPTDAPPAEVVPAAEPPRPGTVRLTTRGAVTLSAQGTGTMCLGGGFQVGSADLAGHAARPAWRLIAFAVGDGTWSVSLVLDGDDADDEPVLYRWVGAPGAPHLVAAPGAVNVALAVEGPGGKTVEVAAELRCPALSSTPVPAAVTAVLARHAGAPVRAYSTYDFGRAKDPGAASAIVAGDTAEDRLRRLRADLPPGWIAYLGTAQFLGDETPPQGAIELVVAPGRSVLDILRVARTDAANYDLGTEAIGHSLAAWDRQWGIDIVHAQTDTVVVVLRRVPDDVAAFAREVYALCPDAVDQGVGSLAALQQEIENRRFVLWWD